MIAISITVFMIRSIRILLICGFSYSYIFIVYVFFYFFFSSRRRHTRCALVTGVQTCALPICYRGSHTVASQRVQNAKYADALAIQAIAEGAQVWELVSPQPLRTRRAMHVLGRVEFPVIQIQHDPQGQRSEEHTSELQSLMRISYAVFCLKKKTHNTQTIAYNTA